MLSSAWGLYPWFPELGTDLIHPDDLDVVRAYSPYGHVCELIGNDGEYLTLRFMVLQFRCKPDLFRSVPAPAFRVGQLVRTNPPRSPRTGLVVAILWHHKRNEPFFILDSRPRRYGTAELSAVPQ